MKKKYQKNHKRVPAETQLEDIETRLMDLIVKRTQLIREQVGQADEKGQVRVDPRREKRLWQIWQKRAANHNLKEKVLRSVFHLLNGIAYDRDWDKDGGNELYLRSKSSPLDIYIPGPKDLEQSRFLLTLAAVQGKGLRLDRPVFNDFLFEYVKGLNQAQAKITWDKEHIYKEDHTGLDFDHKVIYVGQDPFDLYLLLFLATMKPGLCKFAGDSQLKLLDLKQIFKVVHQMGSRIIPLVPGTESLPFRLEASGQLPEVISIDESADHQLVKALILCLSCMDKGGTVRWSGSISYLEKVFSFLDSWGFRYEVKEDRIFCSSFKTKEQMIQGPTTDLDPYLSGYLLAGPKILGGQVTLLGKFPEASFEGRQVINHLQNWGLSLEIKDEQVRSKDNKRAQKEFSLNGQDENILFPLVFALAVSNFEDTTIFCQPSEDLDYAVDILEKLASNFSYDQQLLKIGPLTRSETKEITIRSPSPWWCMSIGLISLKRPNIVLQNPGELSKIWPYFWSILKNLPKPQDHSSVKENDQTFQDIEAKKQRNRRIIVK